MIITLDFETYYDADYSLSKMTTEEYVRDPRFKVHGFALRVDDQPAQWHPAEVLKLEAMRVGIGQSACVAHHAQFDGLILSHHFGIRPALWLDTLSMARIALPHHRHSLDALSKAFGLPGKQYEKLADVKGVRDPSPVQLQALGEMSCDDANKTYAIFQQIKDYIPPEEFKVIDATIRMFTEPVLELDRADMEQYYEEVKARKETALEALGVTREDLQSAEKFAGLLAGIGIDPPTKEGKTGAIYSFAKTDQFMRDAREGAYGDACEQLVNARLGVKSTIDETRCERLLSASSRGRLPVYLRYAGAHTTRWSGGDGTNWQNFRRVEPDGSPGRIRQAIQAPRGYKIVVADSSQIECRLLNWFAGQHDVIQKFANKEDPYVGVASQFYGREITKADKAERGTGKQLELSCGYGAGAETIVQTARLGIYGPPVTLTLEQGKRARDIYRSTHKAVTALWKQADTILQILESKSQITWGPGGCVEVADSAIWGPNGLPMWYTDFAHGDGETFIRVRGSWRKYYGAKLVENLIQFLARIVLSQAMLRIAARYRPVNSTHDELMYVVPVDDEHALEYVISELKRTPEWAPGLPLDAEGSEGERYSK